MPTFPLNWAGGGEQPPSIIPGPGVTPEAKRVQIPNVRPFVKV